MKVMELIENKRGAIDSIILSSGEVFSHWHELRDYAKDHKETVYTEGVHQLFVSLKGEGEKPRILVIHDSGLVSKIKYKNLTILDVTQWEKNIRVDDRSIRELEALKARYGKIFAAPSGVVNEEYYNTAGKWLTEKLRRNRPSLLEGFLCSSKLPATPFKPAYGGGILATPAKDDVVYENVQSYDINSSYPWSALACEVPISKGAELSQEQLKKIKVTDGEIALGGNGFIGLFTLRNFKRKPWVKLPVIRGDDAAIVWDLVTDEIGVVSGTIQVALNPYELKLINLQYDVESIEVVSLSIHKLGKLPLPAKDFILRSFDKKAEAPKGSTERLAAKTALNTIIGFWGIDPFKTMINAKYIDSAIQEEQSGDISAAFDRYAGDDERIGFVAGHARSWDFRWATYALSHARLRLGMAEKRLYDAGYEVLYADTDCIKVSGDAAGVAKVFAELNRDAEAEFSYGTMGHWICETERPTRGVFIDLKVYVLENDLGERDVRAAGIAREQFEESLKGKTIEEIAATEVYEVPIVGRSAGNLSSPVFGFSRANGYRKAIRRYGRKVDIHPTTN